MGDESEVMEKQEDGEDGAGQEVTHQMKMKRVLRFIFLAKGGDMR